MLQTQRTELAQLQADYGGVGEDPCLELWWAVAKICHWSVGLSLRSERVSAFPCRVSQFEPLQLVCLQHAKHPSPQESVSPVCGAGGSAQRVRCTVVMCCPHGSDTSLV